MINHLSEQKSPWIYLLWILVLAWAAWVRFAYFDQLILVDDEWHAIHSLLRLSYAELFATFGYADHSIPIALWLKWLADQIGLNEWRIGLPFLLAGLLAVWAVPRTFRSYLKPEEQVVLGLLLAFSPLLIYYSQQARPYAFLVLLMPPAIVALWRYRLNGNKRLAMVFVVFSVMCAWLHALMLVWLCWALLVAACFSLIDGIKGKRWQGLIRMVVVGLMMLVLSTLLLIWPIMNDFASLQVKTGTHEVKLETFWIAWQLFIGNGSHWIAAGALLITVWGAVVLFGRDRSFAAYWLLLSMGALIMITATDAAWLHHGLVLARYSVPLQIFMLSLLALGIGDVLSRIKRPWLIVVIAGVVGVALSQTGPMREIRQQPNAWAKHMYYHFDYRAERSTYRLYLDPLVIPLAYEKIVDEQAPGRIFEAGWRFEAHFNPLVMYQPFHQRETKIVMLSGSCMDWTYGEFPNDALDPARDQVRFKMNNMVHLTNLSEQIETGDYLVFHKNIPEVYRARPDEGECIALAQSMLGAPWYEDEDTVVFRKAEDPQ